MALTDSDLTRWMRNLKMFHLFGIVWYPANKQHPITNQAGVDDAFGVNYVFFEYQMITKYFR